MPDQHIKGWKELDRKLSALTNEREMRKVIRAGLNAAATIIVREARSNIPKGDKPHTTYKGRLVAPGFASRQIKKKTRIEGNSIVTRIGIGMEAYYALFLETGTRFITKRPWLEPALESKKDEVIRRYGDKIRDRLRKVARRK